MYDLLKMFHVRNMNVASVLLIALFLSIPIAAHADEETESYDGIIIEDAFVEPDPISSSFRLKFNISNLSSNHLTLLGIHSDIFDSVKILMNSSMNERVEVDTLSILQEETLELDTSHIQIELGKLNRAIKIGDKIEFELLFVGQTIEAVADIHSSKL